MDHETYISFITQERKLRDEQRNLRLKQQSVKAQLLEKIEQRLSEHQLSQVQGARKLQAEQNLFKLKCQKQERMRATLSTNQSVRQILRKFREERHIEEEKARELKEQEEQKVKEALQRIKSKYKIIPKEELLAHEQKYRSQSRSTYMEEINQERQRHERSFLSLVIERKLRSRAYQRTVEEKQRLEENEREQEAARRAKVRHMRNYDNFVKEHFAPQGLVNSELQLEGHCLTVDCSSVSSYSRMLGLQYLSHVRSLPKRIQQAEGKSEERRKRVDYLRELRSLSTRNLATRVEGAGERSPEKLREVAKTLETQAMHARVRNRAQGDRFLIDSIRAKLELLGKR